MNLKSTLKGQTSCRECYFYIELFRLDLMVIAIQGNHHYISLRYFVAIISKEIPYLASIRILKCSGTL